MDPFFRELEIKQRQQSMRVDTSRAYTPAEAQAAIARLVANPIPVTNASVKGATGFRNVVSGVERIPGKPGYHVEDPRVDDQSAEPNSPGRREVTASTYGKVIPISFGIRRLEGNIIQASDLIPRLVGNQTKYIEYQIPMYEDPPVDETEGFPTVNINPIPQDECEEPDFLDNNPPSCSQSNTGNGTVQDCGKKQSCDTRDPATNTGNEDDDPDGGEGGEGGGGGGDPDDPPNIHWFGFSFNKDDLTCSGVVANLNAGSIPTYQFASQSAATDFVNNEIEAGEGDVKGIVYQYDYTTGQVVSFTCVG